MANVIWFGTVRADSARPDAGYEDVTDPNHIVAVTAILTRERRSFNAARVELV